MISIVLWLFFSGVLGMILLMVLETQADNLPPTNKFRIWWRKNVVGDDIYRDDV